MLLISCGIKVEKKETLTEITKEEIKKETKAMETGKDVKDVKDKSFDELFKSIKPEDITDNIFKLVGQDFTVITAGKEPDHNSMTASFGGVGILFEKPVTWCFLRASRYTLELIRKEHTYTMSYFPDRYKEQVLFFGSKSGRDTDKMKENTLTAVKTPSGNVTYKEARLIIECKLTELTTVSPDDFYTQQGKEFITGAYDEVHDYHKLVFGEITNVWVEL
jgi:flavin reductase (DIM6/NTAB) family NADH-FMN oxidoreductase RutF